MNNNHTGTIDVQDKINDMVRKLSRAGRMPA